MDNTGQRSGFVSAGLGLCLLGLTAGSGMAGGVIGGDGKWHLGMTAVFSGFLCNEPADAVHGLVAALSLTGTPTIEAFSKVEEPLHCFFSDGPVKFLGRVPNSKVFVDPEKGRFLFVAFEIGGHVTAYSWVAEALVSDHPYLPAARPSA